MSFEGGDVAGGGSAKEEEHGGEDGGDGEGSGAVLGMGDG